MPCRGNVCMFFNFLWERYPGLGRLHPYGSGSGSSSGSGRRRTRRGLSDSPTAPTTPTSASDNASDATLTDSELPLARDSTLLVQNVDFPTTREISSSQVCTQTQMHSIPTLSLFDGTPDPTQLERDQALGKQLNVLTEARG
ncbi:jg11458 [Pararge aegeria aegeria]|uniref:Jg11458 protein n=1 Tax=Pararge aegeria aegeria TaxID=348720 RepID=A0A8S4RVV7_9NEOP|nr:jg11458 [Pararge aegeria aegeria]